MERSWHDAGGAAVKRSSRGRSGVAAVCALNLTVEDGSAEVTPCVIPEVPWGGTLQRNGATAAPATARTAGMGLRAPRGPPRAELRRAAPGTGGRAGAHTHTP